MSKFQAPIEQLPSWEKCPCTFFTDAPFYHEKIPKDLKNSALWRLFEHRHQLREFCQANKIKAPKAKFSDKFEQLAAWAVSRNRFPMVIKTSQNLNNSDGIFILKAFRELPESYEKIQTIHAGAQLIEEFVQSTRYFEVTIFQGKIILIAQIGFEKSMRLRHNWRVFPIFLPTSILQQVKSIMGKFPGLLEIKNAPMRLTFAFTPPEIILLSINSGLNRVEYNPEWSEAAGLGNIFATQKPTVQRICKLLNFYAIDSTELSWAEIARLCENSLAKYTIVDDQAIVLLSAADAASLLEYAKKVSVYFKHLSTSEEASNKPEVGD